jgi:hypothetical protein
VDLQWQLLLPDNPRGQQAESGFGDVIYTGETYIHLETHWRFAVESVGIHRETSQGNNASTAVVRRARLLFIGMQNSLTFG